MHALTTKLAALDKSQLSGLEIAAIGRQLSETHREELDQSFDKADATRRDSTTGRLDEFVRQRRPPAPATISRFK